MFEHLLGLSNFVTVALELGVSVIGGVATLVVHLLRVVGGLLAQLGDLGILGRNLVLELLDFLIAAGYVLVGLIQLALQVLQVVVQFAQLLIGELNFAALVTLKGCEREHGGDKSKSLLHCA